MRIAIDTLNKLQKKNLVGDFTCGKKGIKSQSGDKRKEDGDQALIHPSW